jgi:hypothetical protein
MRISLRTSNLQPPTSNFIPPCGTTSNPQPPTFLPIFLYLPHHLTIRPVKSRYYRMKFCIAIILSLFLVNVYAQDTLPNFSVTDRGNKKILVSWTNTFPVVKQINIQRSYDSLLEFRTIASVPDPMNRQNGVVDAKAPYYRMFYRIFVQLENGKYFYTKSKRPGKGGPSAAGITEPVPEENITIVKLRDSLIYMNDVQLKRFRDSIVYRTKDTLNFRNGDTLTLRPFVARDIFRASQYVFTDRLGNVTIQLPDVEKVNYTIKFFEEDGTPVFELDKLKESPLILDKSNFIHTGWFKFELYANGALKEKHKLLITKDFR